MSSGAAQNEIVVSAPGKIILFGEHAVVYGRTALAGSIDLRTYVSLSFVDDGNFQICLGDINVERKWTLKELQKACKKLENYGSGGEHLVEENNAPPPVDSLRPIALELLSENDAGINQLHLAVLAFLYLLLGVMRRKRVLLLSEALKLPKLSL